MFQFLVDAEVVGEGRAESGGERVGHSPITALVLEPQRSILPLRAISSVRRELIPLVLVLSSSVSVYCSFRFRR